MPKADPEATAVAGAGGDEAAERRPDAFDCLRDGGKPIGRVQWIRGAAALTILASGGREPGPVLTRPAAPRGDSRTGRGRTVGARPRSPRCPRARGRLRRGAHGPRRGR